MQKSIILILFLSWVWAGLYAQDTATTDTLVSKPIVASSDAFLLDMVAQQGVDIYTQDSLRKDSLLADLRQRDSLLVARLKIIQDSIIHIQDSINILRADEIAKQAYQDSIELMTQRMDSVAKAITKLKEFPGIEITPSLIKDPEEDLKEMKKERKNIFSPWRKEGLIQLQFSQSYVSDNWYQGGNKRNVNFLTNAKGIINYKKEHLIWENILEYRAGIANAPSDTLRYFNVTDDLFRIYSKVGYSIVKNLYLSSSVEFKTVLMNTWNTNAKTLKSTFMTPTNLYLSFGLDYQPVKDLSIVFSPATYKMIYAMRIDDLVDETKLGLKEGSHVTNDGGSSLRVTWKWNPVREVVLDTDLYFFSNYKDHHEIDWETNCNFIINRFLTARLTLHPRWCKAEDKKVQFKELLSLGFSHKFH